MKRYPESAMRAALKCIPCNAPIVETTDGRYVCIECGDTRIERQSPSSFVDELGGVRVEKTIDLNDERGYRFQYTIEPGRDDGVLVAFTDQIPSPVGVHDIVFDPPSEAENWKVSSSEISYCRRIVGGETIETSLVLPTTDLARETIAERQRIDIVQPLESAPIESTEALERTGEDDRTPVEDGSSDARGEPIVLTNSMPEPEAFTRGGSEIVTTDGNGTESEQGEAVEAPPSPPTAPSAPAKQEAALETTDGPTVMAAAPAYNEARTIADVVREAAAFADDVLVVDDGSDDRTAVRAEQAGAIVVEHARNRGYGAALKTIFREAKERGADSLVVLDGDRQHDPAEIPKLVDAHRANGAEIVIGSRFIDGSETRLPAYRRIGILVINLLTNLSMGVLRPRSYVKDTQSGFRLYNRRAIADLAHVDGIGDRMDASVDILFFAHQRDYRIDEVGVTVDYGVENANSYNPIVHGYQLFRNVLKTIERERPILSLGIPGLMSSVGGLVFALITHQNYLQTGTLSLYFVVIAIFGTVFGLFSCFTAIVLHALNTHFRKGF